MASSSAIELTDREFHLLRRLVYDRTGIHLPDSKRLLLANRLRRRLRAHNLDSFMDYYTMLNRGGSAIQEETEEFLSQITTNETYFFRNEKLWSTFSKTLLTRLVELRSRAKRIDVWSAAASSGEEAYSVAISMLEASSQLSGWRFSILGTDISPRMLDRARAGLYGEYAVSRTPKNLLTKYFKRQPDGQHQVVEKARAVVRFKFHNLRDVLKESPMDFVLLRNVMMYFDADMKARVLRNVIKATRPGGYIFSGDVDPIRSSMDLTQFPELEPTGPFVYRRH